MYVKTLNPFRKNSSLICWSLFRFRGFRLYIAMENDYERWMELHRRGLEPVGWTHHL